MYTCIYRHCTDEAQKAKTVLSAVIYIYIHVYVYTTVCMHFPSKHPIISCLFRTTDLKMAVTTVKGSIGEKEGSAIGLS